MAPSSTELAFVRLERRGFRRAIEAQVIGQLGDRVDVLDAQEFAEAVVPSEGAQSRRRIGGPGVDDDGMAGVFAHALSRDVLVADGLPVGEIAFGQVVQVAALFERPVRRAGGAAPPGLVERQGRAEAIEDGIVEAFDWFLAGQLVNLQQQGAQVRKAGLISSPGT